MAVPCRFPVRCVRGEGQAGAPLVRPEQDDACGAPHRPHGVHHGPRLHDGGRSGGSGISGGGEIYAKERKANGEGKKGSLSASLKKMNDVIRSPKTTMSGVLN